MEGRAAFKLLSGKRFRPLCFSPPLPESMSQLQRGSGGLLSSEAVLQKPLSLVVLAILQA